MAKKLQINNVSGREPYFTVHLELSDLHSERGYWRQEVAVRADIMPVMGFYATTWMNDESITLSDLHGRDFVYIDGLLRQGSFILEARGDGKFLAEGHLIPKYAPLSWHFDDRRSSGSGYLPLDRIKKYYERYPYRYPRSRA